MKKQIIFGIAVELMLILGLFLLPMATAQVSAEVPSDVSDSLAQKGFSSATIKEVDCNTGSLTTKCFILTNGKVSYNLANMNVVVCNKTEMIREVLNGYRKINGIERPIKTILYRKTGRCLSYTQIPQAKVLEVLSQIAEKKLTQIADVKPVITNPPKTYKDINVDIGSVKP